MDPKTLLRNQNGILQLYLPAPQQERVKNIALYQPYPNQPTYQYSHSSNPDTTPYIKSVPTLYIKSVPAPSHG